MECINSEMKEFMLTLLDMVDDAGPEGVQKICQEGNSDCKIDQDSFYEQVRKARDWVNTHQTCEG